MEDSKSTKIKIPDIRQSPNWGRYLEWIGWKEYRTQENINVEIMNIKFGSLIKVQHPAVLSDEDVKEIEDIAVKNRALFIKIEPYIDLDTSVLLDNGYVVSLSPLAPPATIYVNLTLDESVLWKNISKSGRYSIRRAGSEGAEVGFYKNPSTDILEKFYNLSRESSKKQGFSIQNFADLKEKAEAFKDECFVVLGFDKNGTITGGKFFLGYENGIWYLHAGTTEQGRKIDVGHKMMWDSFLYFKSLGYKVMDMDGIDDDRFPNFTKNWGGFSYFKEKFGGEIVRFPYPYIKYLNLMLKFLAKYRTLPL